MSLPSAVALPEECRLGSLNYSLAPEARSYSVKVQPSNVSQVQQTGITFTQSIVNEVQFPVTNLIFDIPSCGSSPSIFLDTRMSTLNFRINITCTTASVGQTMTSANLRGSAGSFFDRFYCTAQNGNIIEDITELGLLTDTLLQLQMNPSSRDGNALLYGFLSDTTNESNGHSFSGLVATAATTTSFNESYSYSIPVVSGVIGVLNDKFVNVGRTSRLQAVFQTAPILPITFNAGAITTAGVYTITLSDFSLQLEMVDIGLASLQMLDATLHDGKAYSHGITYRTSTASMGTSAGSQTLLAGLRASSIKSLFARIYDGGTTNTTNSVNGKYDSKNCFSSMSFNIGGIRYPQTPINVLVHPSQAMMETQKAVGSFNSTQYSSSIIPAQYCKLSAGLTAQGVTVGASQSYFWNLGTTAGKLASYIYGVNTEVCAKRGIMSGVNATSSPIFLEGVVPSTLTNSQTVYIHAMCDHILIHDVVSGDIQVRL